MIDLIQHYWKALLFSDGYHFTGVVVTLWLLVIAIALGFTLSIGLSMARVSSRKWVQFPVWLFTYVFRGTPLYVQLLIIYSGLFSLDYIRGHEFLSWFFRSGYRCTILALVLNTCAYTTEMFAGAIRSIPRGEIEAAQAYGFSGWQMYSHIIIPSMLRKALPAYSNEVILMLHATSLAFTATVPDILKIARDMNAATYLSFQSFSIAAVIYMCISFTLIGSFRLAEKRWLKHLQPAS
ncbi:ABC transporter permease [Celerinatantimonas yamalensis]|uniref:Histidine/lysine/arginine/ornithine transport system permease protein HisM n=1 Tax=Celerinatantimonas yamalensis TaxID=559956 RepID=A0ABW9G956_9GAMM